LRVLMISKACIVEAYRGKLEELSRFDDVELSVVVPPYWRDERGMMPLEGKQPRGYNLIIEDMALNGHFHLHFYPHLDRQVRRLQPDILHIEEEPYNVATLQATWLGKRVGAKVVFFTWQNLYRRYPPPFSWIEAYNLRQADYAIAGNAGAQEVLKAKGYKGPIRVIPQFGVDPEVFKVQGARHKVQGKSLHLAPCTLQPFTIGFVGRLVEEKGPHILLQAVARLGGSWQLRILGSGPLRSRLESLARGLGVSGKITFDPPIPSMEMPSYYNRLDVLVLPSLTRPNWKEQFGRVLIEAMACGVPAVGSDCGEIPNVIGQAGLVFPEGDADELRARLEQLMGDPHLRMRLARLGRERVLAHYTQARIAAETYEVYRHLHASPCVV